LWNLVPMLLGRAASEIHRRVSLFNVGLRPPAFNVGLRPPAFTPFSITRPP
jgi:hypothetical protein